MTCKTGIRDMSVKFEISSQLVKAFDMTCEIKERGRRSRAWTMRQLMTHWVIEHLHLLPEGDRLECGRILSEVGDD